MGFTRDIDSDLLDTTDAPHLWRALLALDDLLFKLFSGFAAVMEYPPRRAGRDWWARPLDGFVAAQKALATLAEPMPAGPDGRFDAYSRDQWAAARTALAHPGAERPWYGRLVAAISMIQAGRSRQASIEYIDAQRTRAVAGWACPP